MLYRTGLSTPVFGLRREIDRLFEDTFGRGEGMSAWTPAVDVQETDQELRLDLEIPGMKPEDIEITAENGVLMVRGEKRSERKEGDENSRYHLVERSYGTFSRSFQLPSGLDESKIQADYDSGLLSIHIPRTALPQPRKIQIGQGSSKQVGQSQTRQVGQGQTNSGNQQTSNGNKTSSREKAASTSR